VVWSWGWGVDQEAIAQIFQQLTTLLAEDDAEAIETALNAFDFDRALDTLTVAQEVLAF
jgi:hypothetical protein